MVFNVVYFWLRLSMLVVKPCSAPNRLLLSPHARMVRFLVQKRSWVYTLKSVPTSTAEAAFDVSNQVRNSWSSTAANLLACEILPALIRFYYIFLKSSKVRRVNIDACLCEFLLFFIFYDTEYKVIFQVKQ